MEIYLFLMLIVIGFLASIMGTLIGGAMLVVVPTLIFLGVPAHVAIATARFSMLGTGMGSITNFTKKKKINIKFALPFAFSAILGSITGASIMLGLSEELLQKVVGISMILISLFLFFQKNFGVSKKKVKLNWKIYSLSVVIGFFVGVYIGLFGGGGATMIILSLILLYGLDFQSAVANQKPAIFLSSLMAAAVFMIKGIVDYKIAIPLFLVNLAGGWIGADVLYKITNEWIRKTFIVVIMILAVKLLFF